MVGAGIVTVAVLAALIVGAVLWALPAWLWMFMVGVAVGVLAERRLARRRRAQRRSGRFPKDSRIR